MKVGDKVRCVNASGWGEGRLTEGKVYEVTKDAYASVYGDTFVGVVSDKGIDSSVRAKRFELVEPTKPVTTSEAWAKAMQPLRDACAAIEACDRMERRRNIGPNLVEGMKASITVPDPTDEAAAWREELAALKAEPEPPQDEPLRPGWDRVTGPRYVREVVPRYWATVVCVEGLWTARLAHERDGLVVRSHRVFDTADEAMAFAEENLL
jgi:hypothetical protein